jgi:uroporphyrinogen decarboxylase
MTERERFLSALQGRPVDRTPVWIMRQAGRYLPEYRKLKERHSFLELVGTPELATEVTLMPLRRFPLDAAIVFSDILVIPEALGQPYRFKDTGGIEMAFKVASVEQINALNPCGVRERLAYVGDAIRLVRRELDGKTALLGFAGSPWTLAAYMVDGGHQEDFAGIRSLFYSDRAAFNALMEKLTAALCEYLNMQVEAGADAVQIFDSWGSVCPGADYPEMSLHWIKRIIAALPANFPVILFAKGMAHHMEALAATGAAALSLDWTVDLGAAAHNAPPGIALQGNLDPILLNGEPEVVRRETRRILQSVNGFHGHIFNLGHGILPSARIDSVEALIESVQSH